MTALALRPRLLRLLLPLIVLVFTAISGNALAGPKPASGQFLTAATLIGAEPLQDATSHQAVWKIAPKPAAACCVAANSGVDFLVNGAGDVFDTQSSLYRVFGDEASGSGRYFTTVDPSTVEDYRTTAGLFPGNSGQFALEGALNDSSGVVFGPAAPGPGGVGGGLPEVFVPNPSSQIDITNVGGVNPPF